MEHENVSSEWNKILALLKNEEVERKTAQGLEAEKEDGVGEPCELELLRKPPQQHSEGSESYWKAVANQTVRTYCCFNPEPKTLDGMISWTSSVLQEFQGEVGKSCVLTHLDLDALGESLGPCQQPFLRKRYNPDMALLRKLIHGSMIGRNAQRKGDEATCPAAGELLMAHAGFDRSKDVEALFRASTARKDAPLDAEHKELMIVFTDKSVRSRKKKVRGSYSSRSVANLFSAVPFSNLLPEKAYSEFGGHNTADVFIGAPALQPEELLCLSRTSDVFCNFSPCDLYYFPFPWITHIPHCLFYPQFCRKEKEEILGVDRVLSVTEAAGEKAKAMPAQYATPESVFSGPPLPEAFYQSFLKAHSVKAVRLGFVSGRHRFNLNRRRFYDSFRSWL